MTKHSDEIPTDEALIACLIEAQAPAWVGLPLRRVASTGTDNAIYRLGDRLLVRVPRRSSAIALLSKELDWLPHLQDLPLDVPSLKFRGISDRGFDFGILEWMDGQTATPDRISDWPDTARILADFLKALHARDTAGAPRAGESNSKRGTTLEDLTAATLPAIAVLADEIDAQRAALLWEAACTNALTGPPVWLHGDLKADNLIARDGELTGVIDWGLAAVGDPAADYAAAWSWIDPDARNVFRKKLELDHGEWVRAKGWALYGAVIALSYYRGGGNEALCRQSRLTLSRLGLLV